jgi:hypothetical protein
MKMKYFRDAPWAGDEYIEEAKSLAQAAFGAYAIIRHLTFEIFRSCALYASSVY